MHLSFVLTLLSNNDTLVLFVLTAELVCLYSYSKDRNNVIKGTSYREREREREREGNSDIHLCSAKHIQNESHTVRTRQEGP